MLYKTLRKWIKTLHLKSIFFSILLVLVVLYPNLYLAGKQATTQIRGIDSLVDPDDPQVIILAEEAMLSEQVQSGDLTIEVYVLSVIEYTSDYDQYYNLDYWAPPADTLRKRAGIAPRWRVLVTKTTSGCERQLGRQRRQGRQRFTHPGSPHAQTVVHPQAVFAFRSQVTETQHAQQ